MSDVPVRFADGDHDVVAIHGFLCVTMMPLLPCDIDPRNSSTEVWRVVNAECALMMIRDDKLVGTVGIVKVPYWFAKDEFYLANRWLSVLPDFNASPLIHEAVAFAKGLSDAEHPGGLELHIYDEQAGRITILNRSPRRRDVNLHPSRGVNAHPTPEVPTLQ
jgi:hypothetical protein